MKEDKIYLLHIRDAIESIEKFVGDFNFEKFSKDDLTQSAAIRQMEIIGEAVRQLSSNLKRQYTEIPWKDIVGMRDKLIHDYFGVDERRVWETIKRDLPKLKKKIQEMLKNLE